MAVSMYDIIDSAPGFSALENMLEHMFDIPNPWVPILDMKKKMEDANPDLWIMCTTPAGEMCGFLDGWNALSDDEIVEDGPVPCNGYSYSYLG